jgi:hypothetical protein
MKRLVISSCLLLLVSLAFGQKRMEKDPSYSVRNYKHSNKATFARQHNLDQTVILPQTVVVSNSEYKHRYNHSGLVVRSVVRTSKAKHPSASHKHPLGL